MRQQPACWRLVRGTLRTCASWHARPGGVLGGHGGGGISTSLRMQVPRPAPAARGPPAFRSQPPRPG